MRLYPSNALLTACMSAFFMLLGVYYGLPDVCPNCHDTIYTRRQWRVPSKMYESRHLSSAALMHPERIPGVKPIWVCTNCNFAWTNPLDGQYLYNHNGPLMAAREPVFGHH